MHEGHRKRMLTRLEQGGALQDHELLEILLFNAVPRKNTNPLAHELLAAFSSLEGVLGAGTEELMSVKGVGPETAAIAADAGANIMVAGSSVFGASVCCSGAAGALESSSSASPFSSSTIFLPFAITSTITITMAMIAKAITTFIVVERLRVVSTAYCPSGTVITAEVMAS